MPNTNAEIMLYHNEHDEYSEDMARIKVYMTDSQMEEQTEELHWNCTGVAPFEHNIASMQQIPWISLFWGSK